MKKFKIRCSQIGKIMANPKLSSEKLSVGAKTYCQKWLIEELTGKEKIIFADSLYKGNECEGHAIEFMSNYYDLGFVIKNEKHFEDEYFTGTPDIITDKVIDIKCPIDHESFPYFMDEVKSNYFYQLNGYMHLTGLKDSWLVYCLMDAPERLVTNNIRRMNYYSGKDTDLMEEFFLAQNMVYSDLPQKLRIRKFEIPFDNSVIDMAKEKVIYCREYIETLIKKLNL